MKKRPMMMRFVHDTYDRSLADYVSLLVKMSRLKISGLL